MASLRRTFGVAAVLGLMAATFATTASAQDIFALNCGQLWYQRNSIFKAAGYCFHTSRAIRAFGNAGCQYDNEADVPLSERARRTVDAIHQAERAKGCTE